ncbi:MAG: DUF5686 family protein [FCB group bacterium]
MNIFKNYLLFILIIFFLTFQSEFANAGQSYSITGVVVDANTKSPIAGATIRIENTNQGTYSSSQGKFKLPFLEGDVKIKVKSLGYESTYININEKNKDTLQIKLKPSPVQLKGVQVTEKITADQIIERAIKKKNENLAKLKTFSGLLYSKLVVELGGSMFGGVNGNSVSVSATLGQQVDKKYQMFLMETFSRVYKDYVMNISQTEIIQRRQTSNIAANQNIMAISSFFNFYDESIKLINAEMVTPLSSKAFSYYNFTLLDRSILDDRYVYIIGVKPSSDVYPAFEGTLKIVEGTYNIIELNLKPGKGTAISFIDSLHFNQKFEELKKDIWQPTYLEVTGKARVDVIKGMLDISADVTATGIYSDASVNEPLPDSIYFQASPRRITVAKFADSVKTEFWDKSSLREISDKEKAIYTNIDTLVHNDSVKTESHFNWNYSPEFSFNRVGSVILGITPSIRLYDVNLAGTAKYSFGLRKALGYVGLSTNQSLGKRADIGFYGSVFSDLGVSSNDRFYPDLITSIFGLLFHKDYYDFYKKDGWNAGLNGSLWNIIYNGSVESSRQFSLSNTTNRSIFEKMEFRKNPAIIEGNYGVIKGSLSYGDANEFSIGNYIQYKIFITGMLGKNENTNTPFKEAEGYIYAILPTFSTGYNPMTLSIVLEGGSGCQNVPLQYQFRMVSGLVFIGGMKAFYSAPIGLYGGNEYYNLHVKYNLTDLWWRVIGLPLYEGRGMDLILVGSSGKYFNKSVFGGYMPTAPDFYSEVGFGLTRIPTFISNVIFLSIDARWGIGNIAHERFGWA